MALDPFPLLGSVPKTCFAITPSDTVDLAVAVRQVTIGTAGGVIVWHNERGTVQTTGPLPVGTHLMAAHRILATGTTATGLTGWA